MSHTVFQVKLYTALDFNAKVFFFFPLKTHPLCEKDGRRAQAQQALFKDCPLLSGHPNPSPQAWRLAGPSAESDRSLETTGESVRTWGLDFGGFVLCHLKSLCHSFMAELRPVAKETTSFPRSMSHQ